MKLAGFDIRDTTLEDVPELVDHMRLMDLLEVHYVAACETTDRQGLIDIISTHVERAIEAKTVRRDGKLICVYAVSGSILDCMSFVWMLGTVRIKRYKKSFMNLSKSVVLTLTDRYGVLRNYVYEKNVDAIAWLKHLGFYVGEPQLLGPYNKPFCYFDNVLKEEV